LEDCLTNQSRRRGIGPGAFLRGWVPSHADSRSGPIRSSRNPGLAARIQLTGDVPTRERIGMRDAVRDYFVALEAGDVPRIVSQFEPNGWVLSRFLGPRTVSQERV